jgi:hypothetical protein
LAKVSSPAVSHILQGKLTNDLEGSFYQGLWGQFIKEAKRLLLVIFVRGSTSFRTLLWHLQVSFHHSFFSFPFFFSIFLSPSSPCPLPSFFITVREKKKMWDYFANEMSLAKRSVFHRSHFACLIGFFVRVVILPLFEGSQLLWIINTI